MIIGLEGTSLTGKSTIARGISTRGLLLGSTVVIDCYYEYMVAENLEMRPLTSSAFEQLEVVKTHIEVERIRFQDCREAVAHSANVIVERTVDTVLAHTFAVGRMNNFDVYSTARDLISASPFIQPDVVVLLTAPASLLETRAGSRRSFPKVYHSDPFVSYFYRHFDDPLLGNYVRADSSLELDDLLSLILSYISEETLRPNI
jgi:dTMP kinase